jgi:L-amino acid N-acyltransferase YncA
VSKKNTASLAVHEKCGFVQVLDYAKYIDGSVARNAVTLCSQ